MAECKTAARKPREPKQTTFNEPTSPQFKNNDVLDVDEAAALLKVSRRTIPHARVGRKLLFHKQTLTQWVADGADLAKPDPAKAANDNEQLTLDVLTGMLNNGQARVSRKR